MLEEIYKYRPDNDFTIKLLEENELYFSFPIGFNDPFDSRMTIDYSGTEKQWINYLNKVGFKDSQFFLAFNMIKDNNYVFDINKYCPDLQIENTLCQNWVVCCFSETKKSILMWSHYSNQHKGICIGFKKYICSPSDLTGLLLEDDNKQDLQNNFTIPSNIHFLKNVEYKKEKPKSFNFVGGDHNRILEFFYHKYEDWRYEKESRISILYKDYKKHNYKFKKDILSSINFGVDISSDYKKKVIELVSHKYNKNGIDVKFFQAKKSDDEFGLEFKEESY